MLMNSVNELMFHLCTSVGLSMKISMKPAWRMVLGPKLTPLYFGADPYKGTDPGVFAGSGIFQHFWTVSEAIKII